jgi:hypothetical protein
MRKAEFNVPSEVMTEFAYELVERGLDNSITGTTKVGEIVIDVDYEKSESEDVDALEEILAKLREELENEEEEEV